MPIYYQAVVDDPLTSGPGSRVLTGSPHDTITGPDGIRREETYIGCTAWCSACQSVGEIIAAAGIQDSLRGVNGQMRGAMQAVGGDKVVCKCAELPEIIAVYGISCSFNDYSEGTAAASKSATPSAPTSLGIFDEQFALKDGNGTPLADTYYTIRLSSGALLHGTTDSEGRTSRYPTNNAQQISISVGHNREY